MTARTRLALSALLLAAAGLAAPAGAQAVTMAGTDTVAPECATHTDSVNVGRAAAGGNRKDPHELTAAQTRAMESDLSRALAAKGYTKGADGAARKPGGGGAFAATTVTR